MIGLMSTVQVKFWKVLFPNSYENLSSCWVSSSRPQLLNLFLYRYRE